MAFLSISFLNLNLNLLHIKLNPSFMTQQELSVQTSAKKTKKLLWAYISCIVPKLS